MQSINILDLPAGILSAILGSLRVPDILSFLKVSKYANLCKDIITWREMAVKVGDGYEYTDPSKNGYIRFHQHLYNHGRLSWLSLELLPKKFIFSKLFYAFYNDHDTFYKYASKYTGYDLTPVMKYLGCIELALQKSKHTGKCIDYPETLICEPDGIFGNESPYRLLVGMKNKSDIISLYSGSYQIPYIGDGYEGIYHPEHIIDKSPHKIIDAIAMRQHDNVSKLVDACIPLNSDTRANCLSFIYNTALNYSDYVTMDYIIEVHGIYPDEQPVVSLTRKICSSFHKSIMGYISPLIKERHKLYEYVDSMGHGKISFKSTPRPYDDTIIIYDGMFDEDAVINKDIINIITRAMKVILVNMTACNNRIKLDYMCNSIVYILSLRLCNVTRGFISILLTLTDKQCLENIINLLKETHTKTINKICKDVKKECNPLVSLEMREVLSSL